MGLYNRVGLEWDTGEGGELCLSFFIYATFCCLGLKNGLIPASAG